MSDVFLASYQEVSERPLLARTLREAYASAATPFVTVALLGSQAITGPAVFFGVFGSASSSLCSRKLCGQPRRFVRLRRTLEQPDRGQNAATGVDGNGDRAMHLTLCVSRRGTRSLDGFRARSTRPPTIAAISLRRGSPPPSQCDC